MATPVLKERETAKLRILEVLYGVDGQIPKVDLVKLSAPTAQDVNQGRRYRMISDLDVEFGLIRQEYDGGRWWCELTDAGRHEVLYWRAYFARLAELRAESAP